VGATVFVGVAVNAAVVAVAVGFEFDEVGVLLAPHPAIKATGSKTIKLKQLINFFTFASPENKYLNPKATHEIQ